jgi:GTP cyclohydrolase II
MFARADASVLSPQSMFHPEEANEVEYCAFFNNTKHAEYDFLSNFYSSQVVAPEGTFKCSEGLYQYQKFQYLNDPTILNRFMNATGQEAWDLSRSAEFINRVDPQWDRERAMRIALKAKFQDPSLKKQLLDTGAKYLVENSPNGHDLFWSDNGDGTGANKLGSLLMELRAELGGKGVVPRPAILDLFYAHHCDHCTNCAHFTNKGLFYNYCDSHMTHSLELGNFSKEIHLSDIPTGAGRFLYFKTNDIPELVEEGARLIAERIKALGLENPYFVTPEASTFAIAHLLRTTYAIPGVVISKNKKPSDFETFHVDYCAITSTDRKTLYLDKQQAKEMEGKDIVLFDNVCTTGETLRAVYELLVLSRVNSARIREAIVLFTEGEDTDRIKISEALYLPLHRFCYLPLFPTDPSVDRSVYRLYSAATIPTNRGLHTLAVYHDKAGGKGTDAIAFYPPTTFDNGLENIVVRVHDACATSELFDSVKCDCKLQLDLAKDYIATNGGMIIYLNQEGRGIGLGNKMAAYNLQQTQGLNTVEANRALGLPDDARHYEAVRDILKTLGVKSIKLLTNNPRKVECLVQLGVNVSGTVPCVVQPQSEAMRGYMETKAREMRHTIPMGLTLMHRLFASPPNEGKSTSSIEQAALLQP